MEVEEKILKTALSLFFKYGIRHVTMDEIARELGMSKKTIYQYYKEKDDLVNQLLDFQLKEHECQFRDMEGEAKDPVHEALLIAARMREVMQNINPMFFLDLQRFYPSGFQRFQKFKEEFGYMSVMRNLKKGVEGGIYREDLNLEITARYRMAQLDMLMFGNHFDHDRYSYAKLSDEMLQFFLYGICNLKGHKLINHYKKIKNAQ